VARPRKLPPTKTRFAKIDTDLDLEMMVAGPYALGARSVWLLWRVAAKVGALG
jgi:hypothetical protein